MFWKFNLLTTSHIDTLLDKENVTLHELMDEDDILQECKAQNRKLVAFLVLKENMEELVRLITEEPKDDLEEKLKYKYPNTACELLTSDVSLINDALAGSEELVQKLYGFLDTSDTHLNPLLASFFSKVMGLLITRKSDMILEFLKAREDFVGTLLRHIGTSAIMDLLLRLLTCIESPEIRRAMIEWLNEQKIVKKLVSCITPSYDEDIHCNAAQSLCDIIRLGREQVIQLQDRAEPDPLLTSVEMEETVTELLDNMLTGDRNESVIVNGLSVIQTLLEFKRQGSEDSAEQMTVTDAERMFTGVNNVLMAICPRLKDFHSILTDPPKQRFDVMPTTVGELGPPLGNTRLQTSRLIASLLLTNTHSINVELTSLGTINVLMDLYFKYMWNNFLHSHVTQCLYTILTNTSIEVEGKKENPLLEQLFTDVKIIERILEEWDNNDQELSKDGGRRRGFMGHLTRLANDIINVQEKGENEEMIKSLVEGLPDEIKEKWESYVTGTLAETNKKNTVELVRGHNLASSSEDDDADFSNIPFPQDTAMQQAFSDYQLQQMTSNFIDQFGFNEEEFGEQEEKTDSPFSDRISSIDFGVSVNDETRPNASMFEQSCTEKLQQFDNDSDEDIWEEKEITFSPGAQQAKRSERLPVSRDSQDSDSTDSEEELDSPKRIQQQPAPGEKMDIDSSEGWTANFHQVPPPDVEPIAMDTSPWDQQHPKESRQTQGGEEKWADFSNKFPEEPENWADFSNLSSVKSSEASAVRSSSPVAMDTTETVPSSRTNAYLAENKEADLVLESVDASVDLKVDNSANNNKDSEASVDSDVTSESPVSSKTTSQDVVVAESPVKQTEAGKTDTEDIKTDESQSSQPREQSPPDTPPAPPATPPPSETTPSTPPATPPPSETTPSTPPATQPPSNEATPATPPQSPRTPPATTASDCDHNSPKSAELQAQGDGCSSALTGLDAEEDDDLNANFSFLSKVGLLKGSGSTTMTTPNCNTGSEVSPGAEADVQGNGPTNDAVETDVDNIEQIRSQAKDALDTYDTAIAAGASSIQNGPV